MDTHELLDISIKAAIEGGQSILKIYNDPNADFSVERKADNSPLTIADKASHEIINRILKTTGIPILSEEGKDIEWETRKKWDIFWLVDPLDGTKEFIKRNNEFTVNIALIKNGKPSLGVIYVPVSKVVYAGESKSGAWKIENIEEGLNFEILQTKGHQLPLKSDSSLFRVVGSRSHLNDKTKQYIAKLKEKHSNLEIVSKGSSLKICMVAEGTADEYPRFGPTMEWDTAAGHAIANAAGRKLWNTDFSDELIYNKENLLNPHFIVS